MQHVPVLRPREVVAAFTKLGWHVARRSGGHVILTKPGHISTLSVPDHPGRDAARGTLRALIRAAGITVDEFLAASRS